MKFQLTLIITFSIFLTSCNQLPKVKFSQWEQKIEYEVYNDSLRIPIDNPINCPIRIFATSSNTDIQNSIANIFPITIPSNKDTLLTFWTDKSRDEILIRFSVVMGDPNGIIHKKDINLPFRDGNNYKIIQGYNGRFSHTSKYSKYALDFSLKEGDTIASAADGFVVGVIEDYTGGGNSPKWRDYANFITIFHPEINIYSQYVHIRNKGSLVKVGDHVKAQQSIGLSGKTGYTSIEHLHFNVLKPNKMGMESIQIDFIEGYRGIDLKKGDWVEK